jgi:tryptophanyl-tRNA synthetase
MGKKNAKLYFDIRRNYQESGDPQALDKGRALLESQQNISIGDRERLLGYLEGGGKVILPEPQALLTPESKMPGLDGEKMSKSYENTIRLREEPAVIEQKIKTMKTDPARVRRSDPGTPELCPVFSLHEIYSNDETREWAAQGCRTAGIGCLDCKAPLIEAIEAEQAPIRERALQYEGDRDMVQSILIEGSEKARDVARETLDEVRAAIGISHR